MPRLAAAGIAVLLLAPVVAESRTRPSLGAAAAQRPAACRPLSAAGLTIRSLSGRPGAVDGMPHAAGPPDLGADEATR